jgi:serine/threonine-protein kinase
VKVCPVCSTEYTDDVRFCPNDGQTLRAGAPQTDLVGQVIADRYHVVRKLGEGGMGQVYLAEHVKMGRRSAIKVMNPSMVHDPDAVARFNREATNASRITHPNVCTIHDFGETADGLIYLAMEFVEGESLTQLSAREGALAVPRAVDIFLQVAEGLQAAHDLGIVHRDLKPENIMLVRGRDGRDLVKVVDFGIAKAIGGNEAGQKVTKTGMVVGTPEFMSPEQLAGDKVDGRSDVYSLALVFYQMLTGTLPFKAESAQEIMIKRLTDDPAPLAVTRPGAAFPTGLQQILDTALAKLPAERYQQVSRFAADVAAVAGRPRGGAAAPATRPVDTEARTQVLAAGEAKAAAMSATRTSAAPRRPVTTKRSSMPVVVGAVVVVGGAGVGLAAWQGWLPGGAAPDSAQATNTAPRPSVPSDTQRFAGSGTALPGGGAAPESVATSTGNTETRGTTAAPAGDGGRPPVAPVSGVNPARVADSLDALFTGLDDRSLPAATVREAAQRLYDAAGVAEKDRGFAAYVVANAFAVLDDRPRALEWARKSVTHDPATRAYQQLVRDLSGP